MHPKKISLFLLCLGEDEWCTFFNLAKQSNFFQSIKMTENLFAEKYKN